ncbi:MAG: AMP-binding protein [Ectothiorhodospiraceae bacterium]|nr:AMP-binding protein [Ectothiorhodospiraceae bacterium]
MTKAGDSTRRWPFQHGDEACRRYRAEGLWRDHLVTDYLAGMATTAPDRTCCIDNTHVMTYGAVHRQAHALARALQDRGLRKGDVISYQLPNWHEVLVIDMAAALLGLISNPIVPIYREREVRYILADAGSRVMFVPQTFRGFDYTGMMKRMQSDLPLLDHVVQVRGDDDGVLRYEHLVEAEGTVADEATVGADDPRLLMYTSGTTGRPKGVVHSQNTLDAELGNVLRYWGLNDSDVCFMPSPVTHITGYLYGIMFPFAYGVVSVLMEQWDADQALEMIDRNGCTFTVGATPFLQELVMAVQRAERIPETLRYFACGGAPVPPELIHRAYRAMPRTVVCRVYGSTEAPTVSLGVNRREDEELAATTDGRVVGHEVRIVDEHDRDVPPGDEGEIRTRGAEMMLGYLSPEDTAAALDAQGFFRTGDLGSCSPEGYLTISGRKKDLIIRGGENLSAKEIEDAIYEYPGVREVAVVAMPHPRLGETSCAFICVEPDVRIDVHLLGEFLLDYGLARQKHPERVEIVETLPRTASGKVQKFLLRERLRE